MAVLMIRTLLLIGRSFLVETYQPPTRRNNVVGRSKSDTEKAVRSKRSFEMATFAKNYLENNSADGFHRDEGNCNLRTSSSL